MPLLGAFLVYFLAFQAIFHLPKVPWTPMTNAWMMMAGFGGAFCFALITSFGFKAFVEYSPNLKNLLAPCLFCVLSLNAVFYFLQTHGLWTRWFSYENPGGLFSGTTVWAVWSAISLPILFKWRRWAVLPAVLGIVFGRSSTAFMSVILSFSFLYWGRFKLRWKAVGFIFSIFFIRFMEKAFIWWFMSVQQKLYTQFLVLKAILQNPLGIGFGFFSYQNAILGTGISGHQAILPHPASDFLHFVLRFGIPSIFLIVLFAVWFFRNIEKDHLSASLFAFLPPIFIQGSVSNPEVGFLAFFIMAVFIIERSEHAKRKTEKSC